MKQAILLIAYKEMRQIKEMIDFFNEDYSFYIHVDKKSSISKKEIDDLLENKRVVFIGRKYRVNWGGTNYLKTILFLVNEALKSTEPEYFHLISGQDFPIKSCFEIKKFLEENRGKEFLEVSELHQDNEWNTFAWSEGGGVDRLLYYYLYDVFNVKLRYRHTLVLKLVQWQWRLGLRRKLPEKFPTLYGGSAFWTLSRQCLQHTSDYVTNNPFYLKRFAFTYVPDEIFFQTIILNSPFKKNVVNDNLRFIVWENRNGNNPANLDERDFENIIQSNKLFARKFQHPVSEKLLARLKSYLSMKDMA